MFTSLFFPALPSEGSRTFPKAQRAFLCRATSASLAEDCYHHFCSEIIQRQAGAQPISTSFCTSGTLGFHPPSSQVTTFSDCWTALSHIKWLRATGNCLLPWECGFPAQIIQNHFKQHIRLSRLMWKWTGQPLESRTEGATLLKQVPATCLIYLTALNIT